MIPIGAIAGAASSAGKIFKKLGLFGSKKKPKDCFRTVHAPGDPKHGMVKKAECTGGLPKGASYTRQWAPGGASFVDVPHAATGGVMPAPTVQAPQYQTQYGAGPKLTPPSASASGFPGTLDQIGTIAGDIAEAWRNFNGEDSSGGYSPPPMLPGNVQDELRVESGGPSPLLVMGLVGGAVVLLLLVVRR